MAWFQGEFPVDELVVEIGKEDIALAEVRISRLFPSFVMTI